VGGVWGGGGGFWGLGGVFGGGGVGGGGGRWGFFEKKTPKYPHFFSLSSFLSALFPHSPSFWSGCLSVRPDPSPCLRKHLIFLITPFPPARPRRALWSPPSSFLLFIVYTPQKTGALVIFSLAKPRGESGQDRSFTHLPFQP